MPIPQFSKFGNSCETELFEIELIICIKMALELNNQQRLMCHKTQRMTEQTMKNPIRLLFMLQTPEEN